MHAAVALSAAIRVDPLFSRSVVVLIFSFPSIFSERRVHLLRLYTSSSLHLGIFLLSLAATPLTHFVRHIAITPASIV